MDEQLYLLEVLIDDIYFEDSVKNAPTKKQLVISVALGSIVTLEIRSETLPLKGGEGANKRHIDFKCGKSYLFSFRADNLLDALVRKPVEITVGMKGNVQPICKSSTPWDDAFKEMVQESDDISGFISPCSIVDNFCLMDNGVIKGNLQMFLRLSCFGKFLQTQYEIDQVSGNKQFIFKSPYMNTTFMCTKYGLGDSNEFLPVSPLFAITNVHNDNAEFSKHSTSWTALSKYPMEASDRHSTQSECLFPEYLNMVTTAKLSTMTFDIISIVGRPEEEKFIDFMTGRRISDPHDTPDQTDPSCSDSEGKVTIIFYTESQPTTVEPIPEHEPEVKVEKVSIACQCPKTPTVCKHVLDAIKRYQKTHPDLMIYGKRVNYDKIFQQSDEEKDDSLLRLRGGGTDKENVIPYKHKKGKGCYSLDCEMAKKLRSVGISQLAEITSKPFEEQQDDTCTNVYCPGSTRQNLGIQVTFSEDEIPFNFKCQNKYCPAAKLFKKLGLGPLAIEKCQGTIYGPVVTPIQYGLSQTYGTFDTYGPFGIFSKTDTPFLPDYDEQIRVRKRPQNKCQGTKSGRQYQQPHYDMAPSIHDLEDRKQICKHCHITTAKKEHSPEILSEINQKKQVGREILRLRGGGAFERVYVLSNRLRAGAPSKSPIAECQEVMEQFDKILEEYRDALGSSARDVYNDFDELMPLPRSGNCGHARCTYISEPILPPIHWDCPDPLPVGFCQNPECPHLPEDLQRFSKILAAKRRRYAVDHLCRECQHDNDQYNFDRALESSVTDHEICTFKSKCPFSNPPKIVNMMQFDSSFVPQSSIPICFKRYFNAPKESNIFETCANPHCPLQHNKNSQSCSNPNCPLKLMEITDSCLNPHCPLKLQNINDSCSNPDCPLKLDDNKNICLNPDCPLKLVKSEDICSNPDCPLNQIETSEPCSNPDCPLRQGVFTESCSNPECPLKQRELSEEYCTPDCSVQIASNESCHNPYCPHRVKDSPPSREPCVSPDCSLSYDKQSFQSGSCGIAECPFKTEKNREVDNVSTESECANPDCTVEKESCSNPDCPLKRQALESCGNPECPYRSQEASKKKGICGPSSPSVCGDSTCQFQLEEGGDKNRRKRDQISPSRGKDGDGDKQQSEIKSSIPSQPNQDNYEDGTPEITTGDRPSKYNMAPCTTKTCQFMGGKLTCIDCATATPKLKRTRVNICPESKACSKTNRHAVRIKTPEAGKRAMKRARSKFVYHIGDTYPGTQVGHKKCVVAPFNVPPKMGWLWNIHTPCLQLRPRNGWRPGLIGKTILEVIQAHRKAQNMAALEQGKKRRKNRYGMIESETEIVYPKPTLQIRKRDGVYYITMNPLKDPSTLVTSENPYMECTPMQFKIVKNKDNNDYKSCICNDQGILYEQSSSSDSELDLEFTPPAGVIRPERFIRPRDVIHTETQYNSLDLLVLIDKAKTDTDKEGQGKKPKRKGKKGKRQKKKKR